MIKRPLTGPKLDFWQIRTGFTLIGWSCESQEPSTTYMGVEKDGDVFVTEQSTSHKVLFQLLPVGMVSISFFVFDRV